VRPAQSSTDARRFIFEQAQIPLGRFSKENIERRFRVAPLFDGRYEEAGYEVLVPMVRRPEALMIAVTGGAGKHSALIPMFGATHAVTRALKTRDGKLAKSVQDFL